MVDNSLILQCKCKKDGGVLLAKHYDEGWFIRDYNVLDGAPVVDLRVYLNKYYEKHHMCYFVFGGNCFHLCTEDDIEVLKDEEEL